MNTRTTIRMLSVIALLSFVAVFVMASNVSKASHSAPSDEVILSAAAKLQPLVTVQPAATLERFAPDIALQLDQQSDLTQVPADTVQSTHPPLPAFTQRHARDRPNTLLLC